MERAAAWAGKLWIATLVLVSLLVVSSYWATDIFTRLGVNPGLIPFGAAVALLLVGWFLRNKHYGWAFAMNGLGMTFTVVTAFLGLYPRVMVSSLNPDWSLTIYNASSSPYTLQVMTIIAVTFVPVVLAYQAWTYWVFRDRVGLDNPLKY